MSTSLLAFSHTLDAQYRPASQPLLYFFSLWFHTDPYFCSYFIHSNLTIWLMVILLFLLLLSRHLTNFISFLDTTGLLMPRWNTFSSSLWFFQFLNIFEVSLWTFFFFFAYLAVLTSLSDTSFPSYEIYSFACSSGNSSFFQSCSKPPVMCSSP